MAHEYEPVSEPDADVIGLLAFSALAIMTRLAKDGDQAPSIEAHITHARMSARAFGLFEQLEVWSAHRGVDLEAAAGQYSGLYDDLDARTRPSTWSERSVKTFVTVGISGDMLLRISQLHGLFQDREEMWPFEQEQWVREHLAPQIEEDPQLAARLSLWSRRVAGEVLGLVRATLFTHPDLSGSPEASDEIAAYITKRHGERLAGIHLKA